MCTYCGCESIEVIGRFMAEHTDIINAAGVLRRACREGDPAQVAAAVQEVETLLHPHTRNEEDGLFTVMRRQEEFVDHIDSLCGEHITLDEQLEAIKQGDHALVDTFIHDLRHHVEREDNGLFPASAIALEGPDWAEVESLTAPPPS
ncbi:hemerythrin domain-containing protein [Ornithinimicrobium avium]|uniref:Hemerythrin domain-containing protein n=1 Tax=Ornithinimicrobium avium TaxID=2283195 RepID=A0A345NNC2_9MICO|nr:hemerythrin domain-containing protein [Ornithinimicrobium avium]AXH96530.1 hemerythrin domain-containing protein [Ornithinimicrobium avium]